MSSLRDDVRLAVRAMGRAKTATAVLVISLGLGTGANAALYNALDGLLFRPPPGLHAPGSLAYVHTSQFNGAARGPTSYPDYRSLAAASRAFASLAVFDDSRFDIAAFDLHRQRVRVAAVSPSFFPTLGMTASAGALVTSAADGLEWAVISHALWAALGEPADIVGRRLRIGGRDFMVAGIAPGGFRGLQIGRVTDAWIPLDPGRTGHRGDRRLSVIGRLAADGDRQAAQHEADVVAARLADQYPDTNRGTRADPDDPRRMTIERYSRINAAERRPLVLIGAAVLGATTLLLVSACLNVASLLLSRSAARRRELAVKVALGATRRLLMRQALVESALIAFSGAAVGLLLARWTAGALPARFAPEESAMLDLSVQPRTYLVTMVVACAAAAAFAIGPARMVSRTLDVDVLRADAGGLSDRSGGGRFRALLAGGQVALSTLLLICAGLLFRTVGTALEGDLGEGGRRIAVVAVKMPGYDAGDVVRGIRFGTAAADAVRRLPGVVGAGWVTTLPVGRSSVQRFEVDAGVGLREAIEVEVNVASAGYFDAMRIPLVEGRPFGSDERALSKPVVIVNDVFARRHVGPSAVGRHLRDEEGTVFEIVGVARAGKYRTFQDAPEPMVYFPLVQRYQGIMHLVVREAGDAPPMLPLVRDRLTAVDEGVSLGRSVTFDEHLRQALSLDRLMTTIVAASGLGVFVLAILGVSGVIADGVRRRTPEIGLRLALGAGAPDVARLVLGEAVYLTLAGSLAGVGAALLLVRAVGAVAHGLPPVDTASLLIVPLTLAWVVLAAGTAPVRRALRISPTRALRAE